MGFCQGGEGARGMGFCQGGEGARGMGFWHVSGMGFHMMGLEEGMGFWRDVYVSGIRGLSDGTLYEGAGEVCEILVSTMRNQISVGGLNNVPIT